MEQELLEVKTQKGSEEEMFEMQNLCSELSHEWLFDLNFEEKQIWLWNSLVELAKIKRRRSQEVYGTAC
jgi:hypothetical protein